MTQQSGSALCSCSAGLRPKRKTNSSTLLGALARLPPRWRSPQWRVALCIVQSIDAERSEGVSPWQMAVLLRARTSNEALCATKRTPTASAAAISTKNSASSGLGATPLRARRVNEIPWTLKAFQWICSPCRCRQLPSQSMESSRPPSPPMPRRQRISAAGYTVKTNL